MPILERDPWREQYFTSVHCPAGVVVPTDDRDCWLIFPRHRWIYDKLQVAASQGLPCAPHGVMPEAYPVFSKPITNLNGMGVGSLAVHSTAEMEACGQPGHMWMALLTGAHVSSDCAVVKGEVTWQRHATGLAGEGGTFHHWTVHQDALPELESYLQSWVARHMRDYTGMMNFETIGGKIIEAHLRFADQWCDLYGPGWVDALVRLYAEGRWVFDDSARQEGFSIPLFVRHGLRFQHPSADVQQQVRALPGVKSLQITFHETKAAGDHAMPPGGFRLAVINATDLGLGLAARDALAKAFPAGSVLPAG